MWHPFRRHEPPAPAGHPLLAVISYRGYVFFFRDFGVNGYAELSIKDPFGSDVSLRDVNDGTLA